MIETVKHPKDLSTEELHEIFKSGIKYIPDWAFSEIICCYEGTTDEGFYLISCPTTGYSMSIWNDYSVEISSELFPIKIVPLLSLTKCLLRLGIIKIK